MPKWNSRLSPSLNVLGELLVVLGVVMLGPAVTALAAREWDAVYAFLGTGVGTAACGAVLALTNQSGALTWRSALILCGAVWLAFSLVGAVPLMLVPGTSYLDATHESVSGFTTTGFTLFTGLQHLPRSILVWRALMQWLGGLGILSFFMLVSFPGGEAYRLLMMEGPKTLVDRPAPGIRGTLIILWRIYALLTALNLVALLLLRAGPLNSLVYALTTVSTGGFGAHDANLGQFAAAGHPYAWGLELATALFALLGGISFLSHHLLLRGRPLHTLLGLENRSYWGLLAGATALVVGDVLLRHRAIGAGPAFRYGAFHCASLLSSAGFTTQPLADPQLLPTAFQVLVVLMFVGGCLGSTAGGLKVLRLIILWRFIWHEIRRFTYPRRFVMPFVIERRRIPEEEVSRTAVLALAWIALVLVGSVAITLLSGKSAVVSGTVSLSAVSNMGPSLLSPAEMAALPPAAKLVCMFLMIAGRLEILPVLALACRRVWH